MCWHGISPSPLRLAASRSRHAIANNGQIGQDPPAGVTLDTAAPSSPLLGGPLTWSLPAAIFFAPESLPVPRYYFHWDLGIHRIRDDDGVELADDGTALQRAETERELLMAAFSVDRELQQLRHRRLRYQ